jgi:hypothetical protein
MPVKEFTTEPEAEEDRVIVDFALDGATLQAMRPKTVAFISLAETQDDETGWRQMQAVRDFMDECLLPDSRELIADRLEDPDDRFDVTDLVPIVNWLMGEFTTRPTGRPSGSSARPKRTGRPSTARSRSTRASTPSTSPSADSSTP